MSDFRQPADAPRTRYHVPPWLDPKAVPKIFPAIIAANRGVGAVAKDRKNVQQGYSFRGIDGVYDMLHDVLAAAGIITVPIVLERRTSDRQTKSGGGMVLCEMQIEYWLYTDDGSALVIGPLWSEALDSSDKASNKCMAFAHKYAMLQTFTIPTSDTAEGDRETIERGESAPQKEGPAPATIGPATAAKVYAAFAELGVLREQLTTKLGCDVAAAPSGKLDELKSWRDEIAKDKRAAARIFGAPQQGTRVLDINNRIANKAPHPQEGPPQ